MKTLVKYDDFAALFRGNPAAVELANSCMLVHMTADSGNIFTYDIPAKGESLGVILLLSGSIEVEIDLERYHLDDNSLLLIHPNTLINILGKNYREGEAYTLFMSPQFLREININYSAFNVPVPFGKPSPILRLEPAQTALLTRYMSLLYEVMSTQSFPRIDISIASSLISAMIYQIAQFYYKVLTDNSPRSNSPGGRPSNYVSEFIRLLQIHYLQERSVSFYAGKLFISPKYLSLLIKKATGRSASDWIDERVIMEARNLLRYSGKNIQQIAYMLNFPNQSSFGKYFKHITGMSPTEYQKT